MRHLLKMDIAQKHASMHVNESVSVIKTKSPDTIVNKIVKWLCHVFIMTVYSVNVFQCKKSQILVTLPENA